MAEQKQDGPHPRREPRFPGPLTLEGVEQIFEGCSDFAERTALLHNDPQRQVTVSYTHLDVYKRQGLGYDIIAAANPRIIYMAVSGFGYTGPYRSRGALDMIVQGMSGLMSLTGEPDGPAMRCGTSASDVFTGLYAFGAVSYTHLLTALD